jgi:hypothetical protein
MPDLALDRQRVELHAHAIGDADRLQSIELGEVVHLQRRHRDEPVPGVRELAQQAVVLELADDERADVESRQPLVDGAADRGVAGGQQHRRTVQRFGESTAQCRRQARHAHPGDCGFAQVMAVGAHVVTGRERGIGQHHVDLVHRQVRGEAVERALAAHDAHGMLHAQRRLDQAMRGFLRDHVVDADHQPQRPPARAVFERIDHLAAQPEDLVRVFVHQLAGLGRHEPAPGFRQQLLADALFERAQLRADRGCRKRQLFRGAAQAPGAHHGPEVQQVLVVETPRQPHANSDR